MFQLHMVQEKRDLRLLKVSIHAFERQGTAMVLRESREPITAASASVPAVYNDLQEYFYDLLIETIQKDSKTRQAVFSQKDEGSTWWKIENLYKKTAGSSALAAEFHATSVELAHDLQTAIVNADLAGGAAEAVRRSAYFLFAEFSARNEICYAILRLDHDRHLEVDFSSRSGPPDLVVHERDLPTSNRLKDKLAFIAPPNMRKTYDIIVADRKYDKRSARPIAQYFLEGYLGAKLLEDEPYFTEVFIKTVREFARRNQTKLEDSDVHIDRYYSGLEHSVNRNQINVGLVLEDILPDHPALREQLHSLLHERGLTTNNFKVASNKVEEIMDRRRIFLPSGITIVGNRKTMNQHMEIGKDNGSYHIKLKTETYYER